MCENEISTQSFIELGEYIYTRDIALSNYNVEKAQFEKQLIKLNDELMALEEDIQEINIILTQLYKKNRFFMKQPSITYNKQLLTQKLLEKQMFLEMISMVNQSIEELRDNHLSNIC
jgi:hypothetical protein